MSMQWSMKLFLNKREGRVLASDEYADLGNGKCIIKGRRKDVTDEVVGMAKLLGKDISEAQSSKITTLEGDVARYREQLELYTRLWHEACDDVDALFKIIKMMWPKWVEDATDKERLDALAKLRALGYNMKEVE